MTLMPLIWIKSEHNMYVNFLRNTRKVTLRASFKDIFLPLKNAFFIIMFKSHFFQIESHQVTGKSCSCNLATIANGHNYDYLKLSRATLVPKESQMDINNLRVSMREHQTINLTGTQLVHHTQRL